MSVVTPNDTPLSGEASESRRRVHGLILGTVELGTAKPSVFIDIMGRAKVYFSPREALELATEIEQEAFRALGYGDWGNGTA